MLKQGTQIIYMPTHANDDIHHSDCEVGFIAHETVLPGNAIFCRYWATGSVPRRLRTLANSEATPIEMIVERDTVPQKEVEAAMINCGLNGENCWLSSKGDREGLRRQRDALSNEQADIDIANSIIYNEPVFVKNWTLPAGAFGESCGPI